MALTEIDRLLTDALESTRAGALDRAVGMLEALVESNPSCRRAWALLGVVHHRLGDVALAQAAMREAGVHGLTPDDLTLLAGGRWSAPQGTLHVDPDATSMQQLDDALLVVPAGPWCFSRTRVSIVHSGPLVFEIAARRRKGQPDAEPFSHSDPVYRIGGDGALLLRAPRGRYTIIDVTDGGLYARDSSIEAFSGSLVWENGRLPGRGARPPFVEFQGEGHVALWTRGRPVVTTVTPTRASRVALAAFIGWIGRVVPLVEESDGLPPVVLCEGEGSLLLDPEAWPDAGPDVGSHAGTRAGVDIAPDVGSVPLAPSFG